MGSNIGLYQALFNLHIFEGLDTLAHRCEAIAEHSEASAAEHQAKVEEVVSRCLAITMLHLSVVSAGHGLQAEVLTVILAIVLITLTSACLARPVC